MCKHLGAAIKRAKKAKRLGDDGKIELDFQLRLEKASLIVDDLSREKKIAEAEEIREQNLRAYQRAKAFLEMVKEIKTEEKMVIVYT